MRHFLFRAGSRALILATALLVVAGAPIQAQQKNLPSQQLALNRAGEALDRVVLTAKKVNAKLNYGFFESGCVFGVMLKPGSSATETFGFTAGQSYVFIGGGDKTVRNVDIVLTDSGGRVVKQDTEQDANPFVLFKPTRTGRYKMRLRLSSSRSGTAFCAVTVLRKGGYDLPIDRIGQAVAKAAVATAAVFRGVNGGRFNQDPDSWALYGAVLQPKQTISSDPKRYRAANRGFFGFGDDRVKDLDLLLLNSQRQVVASDTKNGAGAGLAYKTTPGAYSIGLVNNSSTGPALVMAISMELPAGLNMNQTASRPNGGIGSRPNGGNTSGRPSPFVGTWSGDWQDDGNRQEGEVTMSVRSDGNFTGTLVNQTLNARTPIRGIIQPNGAYAFAYSYDGQNYVAQGEFHLPEKDDDDIEICGEASFKNNGRTFGSATVTLYKE